MVKNIQWIKFVNRVIQELCSIFMLLYSAI